MTANGGIRAAVVGAALMLIGMAQSVNAGDWVYTVREGDTLWGLCETYTTKKDCWLKLGPYNQVQFPRTLAPGTRIRFPVAWLREPPAPVVVRYVKGEVRAVVDGAATALNVDDTLGIGATVAVGDKSLALVSFADGSVMTVEANTELVFDRLSSFGERGMVDTKVNLKKGSVQTQVKKRQPPSHFEVQTPSAVAAVRGTDFRVSAEGEAQTRSEVFDGEIEVANDLGDARVPKGSGLVAQKNQPLPKVVVLPPAPEITSAVGSMANPYTLTWRSRAEVRGYRLTVVDDAGDHVFQRQLEGDSTAIDSLADGCYEILLNAVHASGFLSLPARSELCLVSPLASPSAPSVTYADGGALALQWAPVDGAQSYRVELSAQLDFAAPLQALVTTDNRVVLPEGIALPVHVRVVASGDSALNGVIDSAPSPAVTAAAPEQEPQGRTLLRTLLGVVLAIMIAL